MHKIIIAGVLGVLFMSSSVSMVSAQETAPKTQAEMLAQIEQLMKLIAELQSKLKTAQVQVRELEQDLAEGAQGDDVKKIQEILATDSSIFNVAPTGFFGTKTKEALMKFQERYNLEVTGKLDEATREVMKELRKEKITPGSLFSDEVSERVKERLQDKWKDCDFTLKFRASACDKIKDHNDDDEDEDGDNSSSKEDKIKAARAALAIVEAKLERLERILDRREYDRKITNIMVNRAQDRVQDAKNKLRLAMRLLNTDPEEAEELLDEAEDLIEEGGEAVDEEVTVEVAEDEVVSEDEETEDESEDEDEGEDDSN